MVSSIDRFRSGEVVAAVVFEQEGAFKPGVVVRAGAGDFCAEFGMVVWVGVGALVFSHVYGSANPLMSRFIGAIFPLCQTNQTVPSVSSNSDASISSPNRSSGWTSTYGPSGLPVALRRRPEPDVLGVPSQPGMLYVSQNVPLR